MGNMSLESELGHIAEELSLIRVALEHLVRDSNEPLPVRTITVSNEPVTAEEAPKPAKRGPGRPRIHPLPDSPVIPDLKAVRTALISLQRRSQNPELARKLLIDVGGVEILKDLAPHKFDAVIEAANRA
jgi:hypothetical protein